MPLFFFKYFNFRKFFFIHKRLQRVLYYPLHLWITLLHWRMMMRTCYNNVLQVKTKRKNRNNYLGLLKLKECRLHKRFYSFLRGGWVISPLKFFWLKNFF